MLNKLKAAGLTVIFLAVVLFVGFLAVKYTGYFVLTAFTLVAAILLTLAVVGIYRSFLELFEEDES